MYFKKPYILKSLTEQKVFLETGDTEKVMGSNPTQDN